MNIRIAVFLCFLVNCQVLQLKHIISAYPIYFFELFHGKQEFQIKETHHRFSPIEKDHALISENTSSSAIERSVQKVKSSTSVFFNLDKLKNQSFLFVLSYLKESEFLDLSFPTLLIALQFYDFP